MGFVFGFAPWIVYWILVGNIAFRAAVLIALGVAVVAALVSRWRSGKWHSLEVGTVLVFVALAVLAFTVDDHFLERWLQPIGNAGIFLVALGGVLVGRPFVRDYAEASVDAATAQSDGFRVITTAMTWMWVVVFAAMTVSALVPPIRQGEATIRDGGSTLSILCYWVLPFTLMGLAGAVSGAFPPWFDKQSAAIDAQQAKAAALAPVAQPAPPADETAPGLQIDAPAQSRHDEAFSLSITGAAPATLTVEGADLYGRTWQSTTTAVTTADSSVIWTMDTADGELFVPPAQPWQLRLIATAGDRRTTRTVLRTAKSPGVSVESIEVAGRPALLATPDVAHGPVVACFGGSEGGVDSQRGAIEALASRGHVALAVGWLDEGAASIENIPLSRFSAPIGWLRQQHRGHRVAALAISRGAEGLAAALSLGAEPVDAVVLISPSSVMWQAIGGDGDIPDTGSWSTAAGPARWAPLPDGALMPQLVGNAWRHTWAGHRGDAAVRPLRLRPAYSAGLSRGVPDDALIASEKIDCPILCLTGTDDALWPSGEMADALLARRKNDGDRHIAYPGAGHLIRFGVYPATEQTVGGIALGGEPEGHGRACLAAVDDVVAFLA
ncbi:MAG: acyl-CoA thioester hydrolase/BAAT C-terminal domain-containing protein [Gordonia sp. (in: high G+C Gram-positive bacteria)]|uniref:acyl-CoA thioester hydrolase/BAAT C-terminal domain-containing protein n=1 Tax=Gordonia sp. (in: high G+C Gram-positive bacteria) TaxID=84139 RepID=UPI0039E5DD3B